MSDVTNETGLYYAAQGGFSGYGAELQVGSGTSPETFESIAEVTSITFGDMSTTILERTHLRSPSAHKEKLAGLRDSGAFTIKGNWRPSHSSQSNAGGGTGSFTSGGLIALWRTRAEKNFLLVLPDAATTTLPFAGVVSKFQPGEVSGNTPATFTAEITPLRDFSAALP